MKVTQVAEILNSVIGEVTGTTGVTLEDLSNVVSVGKDFNDFLEEKTAYDKYVKSLINHIGRVKFVDRIYEGQAPKVLMESWEYGSILEKIDCELPESSENPTWNLVDGDSYDQDKFNSPSSLVGAQFFNDMVTFEIDMSFADKQVKQSFSSAQQLNAFFSMIENRIRMRMTMDYDNLIMRTINYFIGQTLYEEFNASNNYLPNAGANKSGGKAINLLHLYKTTVSGADETLTAETCLKNTEFMKFASYTIMLYSDRLEKATKLFNIMGKTRFTPKKYQRIVLLSEFKRAADVYLQSSTFHNELSRLPDSESVSFWQGSGTGFDFKDGTSNIKVSIKDIVSGQLKNVEQSGIIGTIFDHEALGVNNKDVRVTSHYNAKGEFTNNFYKSDARYFNDFRENFIVFFVA